MAFTAADVPETVDLVVTAGATTYGFMCADSQEVKGSLAYTPTLIPRTATQGNYGDELQAQFWNFSQKDWSKGEQLKYARPNDEEAASRYWEGTQLDIYEQGQVTISRAISTETFGTAVRQLTVAQQNIYATSPTRLYSMDTAGTGTDLGLHGGAGAMGLWGITTDNKNIFMGGTAVRKFDIALATFSTFSAAGPGAGPMAVLNNALYAISESAVGLIRYDTAGTATTLYQWKEADGTAIDHAAAAKLVPFGGKLLILLPATESGAQLWLYDGTAPALIWSLPQNFSAHDCVVVSGTVFVSGRHHEAGGNTTPAIYYYASGTSDVLWRSPTSISASPAMATWRDGFLFTDTARSSLCFYSGSSGGISTIGAFTPIPPTLDSMLATSRSSALATFNQGTAYKLSSGATVAPSATVRSPLIDFDSSLTKLFRGITVEFDSASDGNGGTVDIAYRIANLNGAYTTLQTGAVSGTEYALTNITGRSISVEVTLNKGTSTNGPVLKRIGVRAMPRQTARRRHTFLVQFSGYNGESFVVGRNGSAIPKTGKETIADLRTIASSTNPVTVTDISGTYSAIVDPETFDIQVQKPQYQAGLCRVTFQEV